jgi:hypothetical protein
MQRAAGIREIYAIVTMRRAMIMDVSVIMGVLIIGVSDYQLRRWFLCIRARR